MFFCREKVVRLVLDFDGEGNNCRVFVMSNKDFGL